MRLFPTAPKEAIHGGYPAALLCYAADMIHTGQCHCGAIRFTMETSHALAPRACQCGFCRRHGARTVTDPSGAAILTLGPETLRYRFASGSADYLLCGRCGNYVGALTQIGGALYATLNLNVFDEPHPELAAVPVSYEGESPKTKAARRHARWTPTRLQDARL